MKEKWSFELDLDKYGEKQCGTGEEVYSYQRAELSKAAEVNEHDVPAAAEHCKFSVPGETSSVG